MEAAQRWVTETKHEGEEGKVGGSQDREAHLCGILGVEGAALARQQGTQQSWREEFKGGLWGATFGWM